MSDGLIKFTLFMRIVLDCLYPMTISSSASTSCHIGLEATASITVNKKTLWSKYDGFDYRAKHK